MCFPCDAESCIVEIDIQDSAHVIGCATLSHVLEIYEENKPFPCDEVY